MNASEQRSSLTGVDTLLVLGSAIGCGLLAGVFFAFSAFVMAGLDRLGAAPGIAAMQSINVTAVRPPLMLALFGTAALCVVVAFRAFTGAGPGSTTLALGGCALYLVGAVGVTAAANVPLNDTLAALHAHQAGAAGEWNHYWTAWTAWNHVRTLCSMLACAAFAASLAV